MYGWKRDFDWHRPVENDIIAKIRRNRGKERVMFGNRGKKRILSAALLFAAVLPLAGCTRYTPPEMESGETVPESREDVLETAGTGEGREASEEAADAEEGEKETDRRVSEGPVIEIYDDAWNTDSPGEPAKVKGIYLSAYVAGSRERMAQIIHEIDRTELNAVVIDFKDDSGNITAEVESPLLQELGVCRPYISDLPGLLSELKAHGIYTIARVVSLRDPMMGEVRPQWCFQSEGGTVLRDSDSMTWLNPYQWEVREYLAEVGRQAALAGFDEVQFDYIRFSTNSGLQKAAMKEAGENSKTDIITELVGYIYDELSREGVYVSADVFGTIISSSGDAQAVGQDYGALASRLDYICPMIYPSHYGDGNFGLDHPDLHPYETIVGALADSKKALGEDKDGKAQETAAVRPWLQDFTASWLKHHIPYGDEEIRHQIQAVYDAGYEEWILWSASNRYHYSALEAEQQN